MEEKMTFVLEKVLSNLSYRYLLIKLIYRMYFCRRYIRVQKYRINIKIIFLLDHVNTYKRKTRNFIIYNFIICYF